MIIPWTELSSNPPAWIMEECYPPGFPWNDPSHINVDAVYGLLQHWRQRKNSQLIPLIWNPSCELLSDVDLLSRRVRKPTWTQTSGDQHGSSDSDTEMEDFAAELEKISNGSSESANTGAHSSGSLSCESYRFRHIYTIHQDLCSDSGR